MNTLLTTTALSFVGLSSAKVYFKEDFNDAGWKSRWTVPTGWKSEVNSYISFLSLFFPLSNSFLFFLV